MNNRRNTCKQGTVHQNRQQYILGWLCQTQNIMDIYLYIQICDNNCSLAYAFAVNL